MAGDKREPAVVSESDREKFLRALVMAFPKGYLRIIEPPELTELRDGTFTLKFRFAHFKPATDSFVDG